MTDTIWQDLKACMKEKFDADRASFMEQAQAADGRRQPGYFPSQRKGPRRAAA